MRGVTCEDFLSSDPSLQWIHVNHLSDISILARTDSKSHVRIRLQADRDVLTLECVFPERCNTVNNCNMDSMLPLTSISRTPLLSPQHRLKIYTISM
jgi:hypothetical protein